jgi:hypothetical protein
MLVDAEGVIRKKLFHDSYKARHSTDQLIKAAESIK